MIRLTKDQIDECFEGKDHQIDVAIALYKLVFPDWDDIEKIHSWPECGEKMSKYIFEKFIEFDRKHHPEALNGGLWMNSGWAASNNMPWWSVDVSRCRIEYKEGVIGG